MTTHAGADHGKSFNPQRTQRDTNVIFVVPFCLGCQLLYTMPRTSPQITLITLTYTDRKFNIEQANSEALLSLVFLRVLLCLVLQLAENLRRGFQRQRFCPHVRAPAWIVPRV